MVVEQAPCVMTRLGGDSDVLEHRGAGQDVGDLVRACDGLPGDPVRRKPRDVLAGKEDAAARRAKHTRDAVEERRLAGAAGADDGAALARADRHIDVVERGEPAEPHAESLRAEHRGRGGAPAGAGRGRRLSRTKPGHAFWNQQAGGANAFSFEMTSRSRGLLVLRSKMDSRLKPWR